jgi:CheY-like chemotaxis protein
VVLDKCGPSAYRLPVVVGLNFLSVIPDVPIIACSFPPQLTQTLQEDVVNYLIKPITRDDLMEAIQAVGHPVNKILIVDDDPDVQLLLARMLTTDKNCYEITLASNGLQALNELRCQPPDLILMDITMPELDGWQMLEIKSQDETIKGIPVVIISAQDAASKPQNSQVLLATIGSGLSLGKFLRCSLELSALMVQPD